MTRKRRNRDGISIEDRWKAKGHREGAKWLFKVRDPAARTYIRRAFTDEALGMQWARDTAAHVRLGDVTAGAVTLSAIAKEYVQSLIDLKRHPHHIREVERVLKGLETSGVSDLKARDFRAKVEHWRRSLRASAIDDQGRTRRRSKFDLSPRTANRYLLHVRSLIRYAVDRGYLPKNPLSRLRDLDEPDIIKKTFSIDELRAIIGLKAYDEPVWWWAVIMAYTGMRAQEALHLQWQFIDRSARTIAVKLLPEYRLKRNRERSIPAQAELLALIDQHPEKQDMGWMLPEAVRQGYSTTLASKLRAILARAGVTLGPRTPHSFRHGYAAIQVAGREEVFSICRALGHQDLALTEHYSREAATYRPTIEAEGWKAGEMRLTPRNALGRSA
jgi:integrase